MENPIVEAQLAKYRDRGNEAVGESRREFLEAALHEHLAGEMNGDLSAIVASYADGGHLEFNGVVYDTPERLRSFHRNFGWDGQGLLSDLGGEIVHLRYTSDAVIVEYRVQGIIDHELGDAPAGRSVSIPMCVVYEFDEAGKLTSERGYTDSAALLPAPIVEL